MQRQDRVDSTPRALAANPSVGRHFAFFFPVVGLHLACAAVFVVGASAAALTVFFVTVVLQLVGITLGYHRLLAHRSFKTSRSVQFFLASLGVLAGQNGPLWWVGHHRQHHSHADTDADPHSSRAGFMWSHCGWLFGRDCLATRSWRVADLAQLAELRWLERHYYWMVLGYAALLYAAGAAWGRIAPDSGAAGGQFVVWGSVVATVCVYHFIWSANSVCHRFGTRRFATRDQSRNNLLISLLTLGDGWHNNHHRCPYSARHGFVWWEIDVNYAILKLLERLGIVWDLRLPSERDLAR